MGVCIHTERWVVWHFEVGTSHRRDSLSLNTRQWPNVVLKLGHCLRHLTSIKSTSGQCVGVGRTCVNYKMPWNIAVVLPIPCQRKHGHRVVRPRTLVRPCGRNRLDAGPSLSRSGANVVNFGPAYSRCWVAVDWIVELTVTRYCESFIL